MKIQLPTDRALGFTSDAQEDVFRFNALKREAATTKRTILRQAFSVWDPRERLLPFSIRSKIILQNLNRLKYGWDDELKEADLRGWRKWFKESELLETVQIPQALFRRTSHFEKLTCMCFVTRAKMLKERVRTLDESLKIM